LFSPNIDERSFLFMKYGYRFEGGQLERCQLKRLVLLPAQGSKSLGEKKAPRTF